MADEGKIADQAVKFAKQNRKRIAREIIESGGYESEENPVSVFMAGSPGAGKTEASQALLSRFEEDILRIDPDEMRGYFEAYDGKNSNLFQGATSIIVERTLDLAFKRSLTFVLDGTLSHHEIAHRNVKRALSKGRTVQILYVHQDPVQAWRFVLLREEEDGRHIPMDSFINQYFESRRVPNMLKEEFGKRLRLDVLLKNLDGTDRKYMNNVAKIDYFLPRSYDRESIRRLLEEVNC